MAEILDLRKIMFQFTTDEIWTKLMKMGLSKKTSNEWSANRYSIEEYEQKEDELKELPEALIILSFGYPQLVNLQKELEQIGVKCQPILDENNKHLNVMVISHSIENPKAEIENAS